jgi:dephospho-CoA kinase
VEGALDRGQMRKLVFADANARSCLEAIVHPLVRLEISRQLMLAQHNGARCLVFDIPLLVESSHWRRQFNRIMVVDCSTPTQIKRVQLRNGMPESDVEKIIASQATRLQRTASADYVLHNDDINLTQLREEVQKVAYRFGL